MIIAEDLNGYIGANADGFSSVHGGFGYGVRNEEGRTILKFAAVHDLVVVNSFFKKRDARLITFHSGDHDTQIDYMLVRKGDLRLCKDCKVFLGEVCFSQHRLLALDIHEDRPVADAEQMWNRLANTIREAAKETFGVVAGTLRTCISRRESWWISDEVQDKVKVKQTRFKEHISMRGEDETNRIAVEESWLSPLAGCKDLFSLGLTSGIRAYEIPPPPPPPSSQTPTQQTPHTVSTIKLPILKKGEYDIWAMKMEHYLAHTDYPIWEVIQNGNGPVSITTDTQGQIKVLPPRTAEEILARERERKARTTLLMALPEDHLAKFHKMTDAKEMWDAIKSRFGGNDESKKMQKYILKQQFEGFFITNSEGLHKGYDRFQSLLSQLEIHEAGVSTEDANKKFLRSLLSAWYQVSLIMRSKPGVDSLSFDDLYNNLRVFKNDVKGSTASSSSTQNVAFVSENTISTNDVSTAYGVANPSGHNS
ncbi:ribonuclease H-like domain-containing protein [Tanacetum coccineum]